MLDLTLITKPLTPSDNPGLDTLDPRFQEIATFVEAGDFAKAAEQTQLLLQEGIVDIRVIAYFLYGAFHELNIPGLADIFKATAAVVGPNWPAVGPGAKKEKHTEVGLSWFLGRVQKRLKSVEDEKGEAWASWMSSVTAEHVQAALDAGAALHAALPPLALPSTRVDDSLKQVEEWLKAFQKAVGAPKPAEAAAEAPTEAAPAQAAPVAAAPSANGDRPSVEGSIHLEELKAKLKAFEVLIQKEEVTRAAIIANDIAQIVEKFDPRLYFPKMFASFYNLSVKNVEKLQPILDGKDSSPAWKAMEQLYKCDLETFVQ